MIGHLKVLFVRSGNNGLDPISTNQGNSLMKQGVDIIYFDIIGKGIFGYLQNFVKLRKYIKKNNPDILHAHYSFSGILSLMTISGVPTGVSLMGSDMLSAGKFQKIILKMFISHWAFTIVKSKQMFDSLSFKKNIYVIPNGVDLDVFHPINRKTAIEYLKWDQNKMHFVFASDPSRKEKNFSLAKSALDKLESSGLNFELHFLKNIPPENMIYYYNAADIMLLTSLHEGSPNVIKEAMACNCPIVSTDVGDIKEIIGETKGCFVTSFNSDDVANKIKLALDFRKVRTDGKNQIKTLDSKIIAEQLIHIYKKSLKIYDNTYC
jgi:teichuronic acid biosynthesis glycosyltransferase TuaC